MRTEVVIQGANCPFCLNETLELLRATPGVQSVEASSSAGCLVVVHDSTDEETLVDLMHAHLHGIAKAGNEIVMTEVGPTVRILGCSH